MSKVSQILASIQVDANACKVLSLHLLFWTTPSYLI